MSCEGECKYHEGEREWSASLSALKEATVGDVNKFGHMGLLLPLLHTMDCAILKCGFVEDLSLFHSLDGCTFDQLRARKRKTADVMLKLHEGKFSGDKIFRFVAVAMNSALHAWCRTVIYRDAIESAGDRLVMFATLPRDNEHAITLRHNTRRTIDWAHYLTGTKPDQTQALWDGAADDLLAGARFTAHVRGKDPLHPPTHAEFAELLTLLTRAYSAGSHL